MSNTPGGAEFAGRIGRTYSDSEPWWPPAVAARPGAPNIIVVLLDDMGFSDVGPFGSEIETPTLDRLAERGVRLTQYHTAAVCSPARAALMTGLNPHRAGFAYVASRDLGFPGYTMELAEDVLTLPEVLRARGYATFAVGKWHLTRDNATNDAAVRRSWPIQRGFDRFYGSMEGLNNFFQPNRLIVDNSPLEVDRYPDDYYLTDDLTDRAIAMLRGLRAHAAHTPFFLYVAHHAVHGPLGAKPGDLAKYRGRYDVGWDVVREERFARQLAAGLFPGGTRMAPRNSEPGLDVPAWADVPREQRDLFARYQEVYAAMVDNVDQNLGRLLAAVASFGELDNTIVVFTSDNGATAEGGPNGTRSYFGQFQPLVRGVQDWPRDVARAPELIGGPRTAVHYPRGWGMASNTPFRLYKSQTFAGGVRVPFILSWPAGLQARGIRHQYQYVTDLYATLLDLADVERPAERNGRPVKHVDGLSFRSVLHDGKAPETHHEQYAESGGNRGYYRAGWKILTRHDAGAPYTDHEWQLFDVRTDPTELHDVAADHPDLVRELAAGWEAAAAANQVFPLPDTSAIRRRPDEAAWEQPLHLLPGTPTVERYRAARLIAGRSFEVQVELEHRPSDEGVLVAHGDQGGGYSLYIADGRLWFAYNEYGALHEVDGGLLAPTRDGDRTTGDTDWLVVQLFAVAQANFRWTFDLRVNGTEVARLERVAMLQGLAPFEGIDVGIDRRSPVHWALYERHGPFAYTGRLIGVTYMPGSRDVGARL